VAAGSMPTATASAQTTRPVGHAQLQTCLSHGTRTREADLFGDALPTISGAQDGLRHELQAALSQKRGLRSEIR
jgi:hypothetical protein